MKESEDGENGAEAPEGDSSAEKPASEQESNSETAPEEGSEKKYSSRRERRKALEDAGHKPPKEPVSVLPFLIAAVLVVAAIGALIWFFVLREEPEPEETAVVERNLEPGLDGVIARDVEPEDWLIGDCLRNFTGDDQPATVVICDGDYEAQILHREELPEENDYPGSELMRQQAERACEEAEQLDQDAVDEAGFDIQIAIGQPTEHGWNNDGDRIISCVLSSPQGSMDGSFVLDPQEESSAWLLSQEDEGAVEEEESGDDAGDADETRDADADEAGEAEADEDDAGGAEGEAGDEQQDDAAAEDEEGAAER